MNERFVCVKVDREERPDVDALYMDAVQAMTGHGGWPLNVFLTPEQAPFYGGTYFPPEARQGMPSWRQVLGAVAEAWETQREEIRAQGERVAPRLAGGALLDALRAAAATAPSLDDAVATLRQGFDSVNGGWGGAPKFPQASVIEFLLRARRAADGAADAALDGRRRHLRPGRRRLLALQRRRALDRPALREDALRQRAARARLPARLPGQRRRAAAAHRRGDARLGAARDARARGRLLQRARRRLRGRRGQVLRLERSTSCAPRWATTPTPRSPGSARPSAATSRARTSSSRAAPEPPPEQRDADPRARCSTSRARSACARASTTSAWPPGTR